MTSDLDTTKLKDHISYEYQVREMIREKVSSGEFAPGEKLPSFRKIAASLGTNSFTVHKALSALQNEGLLISSPGRGTFVQKLTPKLTCVGVYCRATDAKDSPYTHSVRAALVKELREAGIEMDLWMDTRPEDQLEEPWKLLIKAAEQRRFQAFISIDTSLPSIEWQQKLPMPTAFLANGVQTGVANAVEQFVDLSLQELARQGCRSVGFIGPVDPVGVGSNPDGSPSQWFGMLEHFLAVAGDRNLRVKDSWMRIGPSGDPMQGRTQNQFGYEEFLQLWSQSEKPEGLVVMPDSVVTGTVMAIREKQVRVPEELKLVLHKNETIDLFCPMPATFVVESERETARALIGQIQKQFRGESCEPISLPFKIQAHTYMNPE